MPKGCAISGQIREPGRELVILEWEARSGDGPLYPFSGAVHANV